MISSVQWTKKEHHHGGAICQIQRHGYCEWANILTSTSLWWDGQESRQRVLLNIVNLPRKKLISELIDFILVFIPSQLNCPQNDGIMLPPHSPLAESPCLSLLHHAPVFLVGCCIWNIDRQPFKAMAYPWILSKYLTVRASVHAFVPMGSQWECSQVEISSNVYYVYRVFL